MAPEKTFIWRNVEVVPKQKDFPIVYCTNNDKIGTFKSATGSWEFHKSKYSIKYWVSAKDLIP